MVSSSLSWVWLGASQDLPRFHVVETSMNQPRHQPVRVSKQLLEIITARADLGHQFQQALAAHPFGPVLAPTPGIEVRTGIKILLEVTDPGAFATAGHLAAYAGLAPRTHRSGTSIRGEHQPRAGNKRLKKAMFHAAFASLSNPASRAYYDRKRAEGKRHNAAILCLARRRCDVLHAMRRNHTNYQAQPPAAA